MCQRTYKKLNKLLTILKMWEFTLLTIMVGGSILVLYLLLA